MVIKKKCISCHNFSSICYIRKVKQDFEKIITFCLSYQTFEVKFFINRERKEGLINFIFFIIKQIRRKI